MSAARPFWLFRGLLSRPLTGSVHPVDDATVQSPLNNLPAVYCRWSVRRRLLKQGRDDVVENERIGKFVVRTLAGDRHIDVDVTTIHLSDRCLDAWTTSWGGLGPELKTELDAALPDRLEAALYHCRHVLLSPDQGVTLHEFPSPLLTDMTPDQSRAWLLRVALVRLVPGALLIAAALWLVD